MAEDVKPIVMPESATKLFRELEEAKERINNPNPNAAPVIGPFPAQPLAAVAALPSKDDPAKLEVQYVLANAIAADFVEVIVIGVRTKKDGGGFSWFGSSQDPIKALGMLEVCKRDLLMTFTQTEAPKSPGAA